MSCYACGASDHREHTCLAFGNGPSARILRALEHGEMLGGDLYDAVGLQGARRQVGAATVRYLIRRGRVVGERRPGVGVVYRLTTSAYGRERSVA